MSEQSPNLDLPYIMPSQAQKHVTHNEAIRALDALVQLAVTSRDLQAPPADPIEGERYIVASDPTGGWSDHGGEIAAFQDGAWAFLAPRTGWLCYVGDEGLVAVFDGAQWTVLDMPIAAQDLQNLAGLGINASSDSVNRLAVSAAATLLNHEGAGHQLKINKNAAGDTASLLFQTAWSGRSEMGLAGNDDFSIKVSADGANWFTGIVVDAASGQAHAPAGLSTGGPFGLAIHNVAELPDAAAAGAGAMVFVSDDLGGAVPAFSDGTDWRRVTDRAVVSA
ncbi:DUF2793 domain-containing protein [Mesorhizobium xinjiangense]|uniref:DUF2793 domain-containing protein n=1 Tax=Mesorhizobium xinjiangense TaxID=2678685 RepID=UPI0012EEDA05|nr:DUF2793 domain-containing protein [Mesorhizobium xinjiangense]